MGEKLLSERLKNAAWLDNLCINPDLDEIADEVSVLEARLAQAEADRDRTLRNEAILRMNELSLSHQLAALLAEMAALPRRKHIMRGLGSQIYEVDYISAYDLDAVLAKYQPAKETVKGMEYLAADLDAGEKEPPKP